MALAFSSAGQVAATCSSDRTVKVWSLAPRDGFSCLKTFQGHSGSVLAVDFLSGGTQLVSTGADGLLKVWTIKTNECEATFDAHSDKVWGLSVSSDGQQLVTGGADSVINVWSDVTAALEEKGVVEAEERMLKEHDLMASIQGKDFKQAVELAFELNHSYRLWGVLSEIMDASAEEGGGARAFDSYVDGWADDRVAQCLQFVVEWNKNATKCGVAQALLGSILRRVPLERLRKLESASDVVSALIPYTERHFQRIDRLVQASFVIDYTGAAMSALGASSGRE
jgi:U3 small nucleolar RNA-associated protein 13